MSTKLGKADCKNIQKSNKQEYSERINTHAYVFL